MSSGIQRFPGLSRASTVRSFKDRYLQTNVLKASGQRSRKRKNAEQKAALIKEMSSEDRHMVWQADNNHMEDCDDVMEAAFNSMPPGEEGFDFSHEGGEHEVFEEFSDRLHQMTGIRRVDHRDRSDRTQIRNQQWDLQYERLIDAYLEYSQKEEEGKCQPGSQDGTIDGTPLALEVIDIFYRDVRKFMLRSEDVYANVALVRNGYIGASPIRPTIAISLRTLAVYRQTHRVCPRLSIQGEVRKLCHLHKVPYRRYLSEQFTIAYDVYLEIMYRVDARIRATMHQDSPDYQLLHACPACMYKLQDEPALPFSLMCEMDGNNSLKRISAVIRERRERTDSRRARGPFWISREEVDHFKDEVKRNPGTSKDSAEDDSADLDDWEDDGASDPVATCIERWRNAGPEQRKRMFALFDESGIFAVACRHGVVLLVCDMVKSGELAKYGLAMVDRLMGLYGPDLCIGYDVGCAFEGTVSRSSLSERAQELRVRMVVGAFHGHAHNRGCQLRWHPLYVRGTGRSDFEGCERVFSASNAVAAATRHATSFHRHQAIDEHFMFWNMDKYALLSNFLTNHYHEALHVIETFPSEISQIRQALEISDDDCFAFIQQEREYLQSLKKEPPEETLRYEYVEALDDLHKHQDSLSKARAQLDYVKTTPALANVHKSLVKVSGAIRVAERAVNNAETTVTQIEINLHLSARWTADHEEYQYIKGKLSERKYQRALDELERLVVQRLFELSKLNMSGTGYKMRQQITKALQRRSEAIKNALKKYNSLAQTQTPPRPRLSWNDIVEYSFLGEFELLRHSRSDVRTSAWAQPANRELTLKVLQLEHAREEITRLNVEVKRLRTFIRDETSATLMCIKNLEQTKSPLAAEIQKRWELQRSLNAVHLARLDRLAALPSFSGSTHAGMHIGALTTECLSPSSGAASDALVVSVVSELMDGEDGSNEIREDDEVLQDLDNVSQFIEGIMD